MGGGLDWHGFEGVYALCGLGIGDARTVEKEEVVFEVVDCVASVHTVYARDVSGGETVGEVAEGSDYGDDGRGGAKYVGWFEELGVWIG